MRAKHNQSIENGEKLVCTPFELLKKTYKHYIKSCFLCSACLWFIDHTHSISIIYYTAHSQAQSWKGSSNHKTVTILRYRARGVYTLRVLVLVVSLFVTPFLGAVSILIGCELL